VSFVIFVVKEIKVTTLDYPQESPKTRMRKLLLRTFHDSMTPISVAANVTKPDSSLPRKFRPALVSDPQPE